MGALWSFCPPAWTPNASRSSQLGARSAPGPPGWSQDGSKAIQDAMWLGLEKPKWPRSHPRTPLAWSQNGLRSPQLCGKSALRPPGPPKWIQDWTQRPLFMQPDEAKTLPWNPHAPPKTPQLELRMPPGPPNLEPWWPQDLQGGSQMPTGRAKMPCGCERICTDGPT